MKESHETLQSFGAYKRFLKSGVLLLLMFFCFLLISLHKNFEANLKMGELWRVNNLEGANIADIMRVYGKPDKIVTNTPTIYCANGYEIIDVIMRVYEPERINTNNLPAITITMDPYLTMVYFPRNPMWSVFSRMKPSAFAFRVFVDVHNNTATGFKTGLD